MTTKELNIAFVSSLSDDVQEDILLYLTKNFAKASPFAPKTKDEIYEELAESRACYARGEYEDFEEAINSISIKYGL